MDLTWFDNLSTSKKTNSNYKPFYYKIGIVQTLFQCSLQKSHALYIMRENPIRLEINKKSPIWFIKQIWRSYTK